MSSDEGEHAGHILAIRMWESEGGAVARCSPDEQYGRRIEANRSWTVYHVFSGVPARTNDQILTNLGWLDATNRMLALNHRNDESRERRVNARPVRPEQSAVEAGPT